MKDYQYYIANEFKNNSNKIPVINPVTGEQFATISETTTQELDIAIKSAKVAGNKWKNTSFKERALALREIAKAMMDNLQILSELETKEIGKLLKESLFIDITIGADCFNYYASFLESLEEKSFKTDFGLDLIKYEPYGVVGVYLPYNVPLMIFGFACAGALAAGNSLIIKPSEYGSLSILQLAQYIAELDLPKGLINIVTGDGPAIGKALAESNIDLISFTGARDTLKKVVAATAQNPKKIICELGGCNLSAIFSDTAIDTAVQNLLGSSFMKQGQMCIGTSLALVQQDIYKEVISDLVNRLEKIKIGDPMQPDVGIGPLPTKEHLDNVQAKVDALKAKGAKVLTGGKIQDGQGYFYPPTVIEVTEDLYEEFFAPVILVKSFKDTKEVENFMDNNPTGLVTQIWTNDSVLAYSLADRAKSGTVWINSFAQMNSQTPFGGMGTSGWGRNLGTAGFFEYVQQKHIGIGLTKSPVWGWFGL